MRSNIFSEREKEKRREKKQRNGADAMRLEILLCVCRTMVLSFLELTQCLTYVSLMLLSAGSQHGRSHPWQGHAERPDGQGESGFRGSPWVFLNIYPQKPESACFITVLSTLLTFSGKKLTQGFSLRHMKGMFQLKPLWWLSNLPDRFPWTFYNLRIVYSPPTARGTKLKAS